jgi:hypothetical protein
MSKTELIISVIVKGHGSEDYLNPFDRDSEIGKYYRNNAIVYSTSGVPDISSLMSIETTELIINTLIQKFRELPESDTRTIVNAFAREFRHEYKSKVLKSGHKDKTGRAQDPMYLSEISNVIAYLANKTYFFYRYVEGDAIHPTVGITVTDVRQKITHPDGSISYNIIDFPARVGKFNLIYKDGVESFAEFLDNKLGIGSNLTLEQIFRPLNFTGRKDVIGQVSLHELYDFFKLMQIDYVNIFDLSCRDCTTRRLSEDEIADIGNSEYVAARNANAFGTKKRQYKKRKDKLKKRRKTKKTIKY